MTELPDKPEVHDEWRSNRPPVPELDFVYAVVIASLKRRAPGDTLALNLKIALELRFNDHTTPLSSTITIGGREFPVDEELCERLRSLPGAATLLLDLTNPLLATPASAAEAAPVETVKPEPQAEPVAAEPATSPSGATIDRGALVKRKALIERNCRRWESIERDLKDASENGLSKAAKAETYGDWWEGDAIKWAEAKGKLPSQSASLALASVVHRMAG